MLSHLPSSYELFSAFEKNFFPKHDQTLQGFISFIFLPEDILLGAFVESAAKSLSQNNEGSELHVRRSLWPPHGERERTGTICDQ